MGWEFPAQNIIPDELPALNLEAELAQQRAAPFEDPPAQPSPLGGLDQVCGICVKEVRVSGVQ